MRDKYQINFMPDGKQIWIHSGATVLEAAHQAGIILNTTCGGKGTCGKCKVLLAPDQREVLACQHKINSDLTVTIPPESRFFRQKILEHGFISEVEIYPAKENAENTTFGVAVDIGTTTVVAKLFDLINGRERATAADFNPQARFGDDVISRISYVESQEKRTELQKIIIDCLNKLTKQLADVAGVDKNSIDEMVVVGNTTMNHLFLSLPVEQLGQAPYLAHSLDGYDIPAEKLGIDINPAANIHTVENIAGFVGSDITAAALATAMNHAEQMTLLIDIGTNGEIVLGTKNKLYSASCAAGPAFEGARIIQGSRAVVGAIEAVVINENNIDIDVIGNQPPASICGSGLIDAVAVMLELGVIDKTGRFIDKTAAKDKLPPKIFERLIQIDSQPAFVLAFKKGKTPAVSLTQKDIREVQLAKAAIRSGIKLLQMKLDLQDDDIQQILLAGAFGNYIRKESALKIGLLPDVGTERIHFVGNAACAGAQMILLNKKARDLAKRLAEKIQYVEIARLTDFSTVYADSMLFVTRDSSP
ncbi:MAG: DUF4445 domain-containing protein [Sedimentisphaerales bacterium]|nr:DUF4445 domain-containing protein [Sedimentisphaerales bacterium]